MIAETRDCFGAGKIYYSRHARYEMENDEFGEILDREVYEAVLSGKVMLNLWSDAKGRPVHMVCAYSAIELLGIVITVYEPDPEKWFDFLRRKQ
ncbi:MAG: DUF4258 domain-containing protein [Deltaproteobacteria bacterium]|nr:DUF4258 domain-containing protein [Deltaproteobacteria bacterium]